MLRSFFSNFSVNKLQIKRINVCNHRLHLWESTSKRSIHKSAFHLHKLYVDRENEHAFQTISTLPLINQNVSEANALNDLKQDAFVETAEQFAEFSQKNFRICSTQEVINGFLSVKNYCIKQNLTLSDERLNNLVDGLMDCAEKLEDSELLLLLDILIELPPSDGFRAHNFHDVWSCLDDVCCWRLARWDNAMLFAVADKWYRLGLGKICDFLFQMTDRLSQKRCEKLSKDELVHLMFLLNVCRRRKIEFDVEVAVQKLIGCMNLEEAAVVALGFFKTQCKVKLPGTCAEMLRIAKETKSKHEIALCAIIKTVRYSASPLLADQILDFLDRIAPEMDRFSILCQLHIALLGTTIQLEHRASLETATLSIAKQMNDPEKVRLKDIERILLALAMFDLECPLKDSEQTVFEKALQELCSSLRSPELVKHPRALVAALNYLAIKGVYSKELTNRVLEAEWIEEVFGKGPKLFPRALFLLNASMEIECPNYGGNKIDLKQKRKVVKYLVEFGPSRDQFKKPTYLDQLFFDVEDTLVEITGHSDLLFKGHVLPQFSKTDIVLCRNPQNGLFVKPEFLWDLVLGDIIQIADRNLQYFAFVIVGMNGTIRDTSRTVGLINMKLRQLKKVGFIPLPVIWNVYSPLSKDLKRKHLLDLIRSHK